MTGLDLSALDLTGLAHEDVEYPSAVAGRTVQIDADFLAYHVSYEKEGDPKSTDDMKHNAEVEVEHIRKMAGAEKVFMHLTPFTSDKGGRFNQAILKPYQGNRTDKEKPRMLHVMRDWLSKRYPGALWDNCEADDGMSSFQYAAIANGDRHLSIIASKDKDLDMVPGLHMVWDTGQIIDTASSANDDFGWVELATTGTGTTKKLKGYGYKWFWAQMLIGDSADNISGIPALPGNIVNHIDPTAAVRAALQVIASNVAGGEVNEKALAKARATIASRKPKKCGPATAIKLLDMMHDNRQAFRAVKGIYESYGQQIGFVDYDGNPIDWQRVFVSEAQLLWMRRKHDDAYDVVHWFKEIAS